ncbi:hypothetical protein [Streptomyces sp. NPDC002825]|uniref:hypothetical protein n=1 Tax=Streptomyces sp. NPDC002825 TaxID=3154666 RepID=UPI00332C1917
MSDVAAQQWLTQAFAERPSKASRTAPSIRSSARPRPHPEDGVQAGFTGITTLSNGEDGHHAGLVYDVSTTSAPTPRSSRSARSAGT